MQSLLLVFIGGGLGAACRYFSTTHIGALFGTYFPFGTTRSAACSWASSWARSSS